MRLKTEYLKLNYNCKNILHFQHISWYTVHTWQ